MNPKPDTDNKMIPLKCTFQPALGIFPNFIFVFVFSIMLPLTLEAQPSLNWELTEVPEEIANYCDEPVFSLNQNPIMPDPQKSSETQITVSANGSLTVSRDGVENTIFIGGAGFKGKVKECKVKSDFTHYLGFFFTKTFAENDFKLGTKNKRFLAPLRNSIYSLKFGDELVPEAVLKKGKHKPLRKSLAQAGCEYPYIGENIGQSGEPTEEPINLIGSSFGSVIAAQIAVFLIEQRRLSVKSLTLSASPIDEHSELGKKLKELNDLGKIEILIYQPTPGDNYTGAAGHKSAWNMMFPKKSENVPSILSRFHPHNLARKDLSRADEILCKTVFENETEGEGTAGEIRSFCN